MPSRRMLQIALPVALSGAIAIFAAPALAQTHVAAKQAKSARTAKPAPAKKEAAVTPSDQQPTLLGQYGDWGAYTASPGGRKLCFAIARPTSSSTNPPRRPRDPAWLFVSNRPAEKVHEEVSVIIGYNFKTNSEAIAEVGNAKFALYTQNDGAWIKNAAEENRMVEAMRKGADIVVKGESSRGTKTTDTFSLKGLTQALEKAGQECK